MKTRHYIYFLLSLILAAIFNASALPLTNFVPLTANLTLYLGKEFGGPTNCFSSDEMICQTLLVNGKNLSNSYGISVGTNIIWYRSMPTFAKAWDFRLFDNKGQEVSKTQKGLAKSSTSISSPKNTFDLERNFKSWAIKGSDTHKFIRPDEMFIITNKGVYTLEVKRRLCVPLTNGMPNTNLMKNVYQFEGNDNFGVIESPAVRVEVIKE